ncbi:hypothetical protein ABT288_04775 [Streptomyces sp. NPDC001093]|uniref:hypothetical protein n=1 Tax=Streptomyces sp. NPDC001093 TaxID=3154376 RepID=UPI0033184B8D
MKVPRSTVVTAGVAAAAALAATGITYASAASAPAPESAPAAAAAAPLGGEAGQGKGNEGREGREGGRGGWDWGRIQINERSYSARPGDCITVISGLGAKTLNIRNDSHKVVEVFRGAVCDNGAPVAIVGPHSQSDGVRVHRTDDIHVKDGVVGSFRVVGHDGWGWGRNGEEGGR